MTPSPEESSRRHVLLFLPLALALIPRLLLAWREHGLNHPDELFQVLEPAHRFVFGFGIQSWEFQTGARSWFLPGIVGLIWKGLSAAGVDDPLVAVPLLRLPFVALGVLSVFLAARLARRLGGERAGVMAALATGFLPLALLLDFRATTEAASAPLILAAVLLLMDGRVARAGALIGVTVLLRPTNAVVGVAVAASLAFERRPRDVVRLVAGALPVAIAGGLLDLATWGRPFHSMIEYLRFNLFEGGARGFGVEPAWFYGWALLVTAPFVALTLPTLIAVARRSAPARAPLFVTFVYLLVHSAQGHKEVRFLLPIAPLMVALGAVGLNAWLEPILERRGHALRAAFTPGLGVIVVTAGLVMAWSFTYAGLRDNTGRPMDTVLAGQRDAVQRLMREAGRRDELCGLVLVGVVPNELFSGGYTYLHRDVPLTSPGRPAEWPPLSKAANLAITAREVRPPGWEAIAEQGDLVLRRRSGPCAELPEAFRPRYIRAGNAAN